MSSTQRVHNVSQVISDQQEQKQSVPFTGPEQFDKLADFNDDLDNSNDE